jgi:hypothetical protein
LTFSSFLSMSERKNLEVHFLPFYQEGAPVTTPLAPPAVASLPAQLSRAVPAYSKLTAAADAATQALNRLEEQAMAKTEPGFKAAKTLAVQRKRQTPEPEPPPVDVVVSALPPFGSMEDEQDENFFRRLDRLEQESETATRIPTLTETLAYAASLKNNTHALWLQASQYHLIHHGVGKWETVPLCSREYLAPFWFEPDPSNKWERPCSRPECESLRCSGPRLRELIYPEELARFKAPGGKLPALVGWCVRCHLAVSNELYLAALNRLNEKRQVDGVPDQQVEQHLHRIHHFAVIVDVIGEYRLSQTICGNPRIMGIFGFFPTYNVHNYIPVVKTSKSGGVLRGWRESDALVFRQARAVSDLIESSPTTLGGQEKSSIQSALIGGQRPISGSRP